MVDLAEHDDAGSHDADQADAGEPEPYVAPRRKFGFMFWASVAFLSILLFLAVFANYLPFILDPDETFRGRARMGPTWKHPFGNDNIEKDVFSRVIYGARVSLLVTGAATLIGVVSGSLIGLATGFNKGAVDNVLTRIVDLVLAFPAIILALALIIFFDNEGKHRQTWLMITLGVLSIPPIARVIRAATLSYADREFVHAARTLGARNGRILFREVFPNVIPTIFSYALIFMAILVVIEAGIGFLGLSVPPPTPTWGDMINKGRNELETAAHISLMPALVLFLTVLSLNYIGDKVREIFDVREAFL